MNEFPILLVGPDGGGKTSALRTLCQRESTRRRMVVVNGDKRIAVGVEQAALKIPDVGELALRLYPAGRSALLGHFLRQMPHAGVLLLLDGGDESAIEQLRHYLKQLTSMTEPPTLAIGLTQAARLSRKRFDGLAHQAADFGLRCPLFRIDETRYEDVALLLESLLLTIHVTMDEETLDGFSSFTEPLSSVSSDLYS